MVGFSLDGLSIIPCVTLHHHHHPRKPYCLVNPQFTKIRPFSIRATNNKFLSVYTIGNPQFPKLRPPPFSVRSQNNKSPSSSIYTGFDYSGRKVTTTIGDVLSKNPLNSLIINAQVSGGHFFVYLLKRTADFLLRVLKALASTLWIISFLPPFAASCLVGMPFTLWITLCSRPSQFLYYIYLVLSGKVVQFLMPFTLYEGDPITRIEKQRWEMIGQYIALNGGVVTAEEIATYLDPQNTDNMDDESYMLPVLQQFNGHPELDEEGNILYHFSSMHCISLPRDYGKKYAGRWVYQDIKVDKFLKEALWTDRRELSAEEMGHIEFILVLNTLFSLCCVWLCCLCILWNWPVSTSNYCLIYLILLLVMFVVHSACSWVFTKLIWYIKMKRNDKIIEKNKARERLSKALELPDPLLKRKLLSARNMAWKASIGNNRFVYKKEKDLYEQHEYERQEWDQIFNEKENERFKAKEENEMEDSKGLVWFS